MSTWTYSLPRRRGVPKLIDEDIPSQCCVMRSPYLYSSPDIPPDISGIFIRNEYVQAVNDLVAFAEVKRLPVMLTNLKGAMVWAIADLQHVHEICNYSTGNFMIGQFVQ